MTDALIAAHIGQPHEPAGIVLVERIEELAGEFDNIRKRWRTTVRYAVRLIERPDAGARLGEVAELVEGLCAKSVMPGTSAGNGGRLTLLVNISSCGRPPVDLLAARRLKPIPIVTTQSDAARRGRGSIHVPERDLLAQMSILIGENRYRIPRDVAHVEAVRDQMREFTKKSKPKTALEPWREEQTGELVMALALAGWWGENRLSLLVKQPPPPRVPPDPPRWPTFNELLDKSRRARLARSPRI